MEKINKIIIQQGGVSTEYELGNSETPTLDSVIDNLETTLIDDKTVENPSFGKTLRQIIIDNELVAASALNDLQLKKADISYVDEAIRNVEDLNRESDRYRAFVDCHTSDVEGEAEVEIGVAEKTDGYRVTNWLSVNRNGVEVHTEEGSTLSVNYYPVLTEETAEEFINTKIEPIQESINTKLESTQESVSNVDGRIDTLYEQLEEAFANTYNYVDQNKITFESTTTTEYNDREIMVALGLTVIYSPPTSEERE